MQNQVELKINIPIDKRVRIIPYIEIDGKWMFPEDFIKGIHAKIKSEGTLDMVFFDGSADTPEQFLELMKSSQRQLFIVFFDAWPAGFVYLSNIHNRAAYFHGCVFKQFWGIPEREEAWEYILTTLFIPGLFDIFFGLTPKENFFALERIKKSGWKKIAEIPYGVWDNKKQKRVTAVLSHYTGKEGVQNEGV
jgi:hypothetical protein